MIKYYAYYNHGGYKDFYIGSQEEDIKSKYFLPLLAVNELSLVEKPDDEELRTLVEHQRSLPKLIALSDKTVEYNYPSQAKILMSHGGYKVLYRSIGYSQYVLAIRDIAGPKDVYGRQTPFNMMFVGDNVKDKTRLDIIANYVRRELVSLETTIASMFVNDFTENGLRCDTSILRAKLDNIISTGKPLIVQEEMSPTIRMLVIPTMGALQSAIKEQKLDRDEINVCYKVDGSTLFGLIERSQANNSLHIQSPVNHSSFRETNPHAATERIWNYIKGLEKRIALLEKQVEGLNTKDNE